MALFAAKEERASLQGEGEQKDSEKGEGVDTPHGVQRMSRATASFLPCALPYPSLRG